MYIKTINTFKSHKHQTLSISCDVMQFKYKNKYKKYLEHSKLFCIVIKPILHC